jgi:anti-repressor protein
MNPLIKIDVAQVGGATVQTVNGRDLYIGLGLDLNNWKRWAVQNIESDSYFLENRDWVGFLIMRNGNETTDYAVSIEFAKHLAMMARTEKAHEYRNYFLECEKRASAFDPVEMLNDPAFVRSALLSYSERIMGLEATVKTLEPKAEVHDRITESVSTLCIRDAAKTLQVQPSKLTTWLVMNRWIYHRAGKSGYLAYQDRIQSGYLVHKSTPYKDSVTGDDKISEQVRITGRGLTALAKHLTNDFSGVIKAAEKKRGPPRSGQDFIQ